jgi:hypothetical protein
MKIIRRVKEIGVSILETVGILKKAKSEIEQVIEIVKTHDSDNDGKPDYQQILDETKINFQRVLHLLEAVLKELRDVD